VATPLPTLTVRSRITGLDPVILVSEKLTPLGAPSRERFTVPVKPPCGVKVSWMVPLEPCWTVRLVGLREMVKSGELLPWAASVSKSAANNPAP
jgi:hypothetical protein